MWLWAKRKPPERHRVPFQDQPLLPALSLKTLNSRTFHKPVLCPHPELTWLISRGFQSVYLPRDIIPRQKTLNFREICFPGYKQSHPGYKQNHQMSKIKLGITWGDDPHMRLGVGERHTSFQAFYCANETVLNKTGSHHPCGLVPKRSYMTFWVIKSSSRSLWVAISVGGLDILFA